MFIYYYYYILIFFTDRFVYYAVYAIDTINVNVSSLAIVSEQYVPRQNILLTHIIMPFDCETERVKRVFSI